MAKVNKFITLRKALLRGAQYAAVAIAALTAVPVPADVGVSEQAAIVFGLAAVGAVVKAVQNYRKTAARPVRYTGYVWPVALAVGLGGLLAGCVTTTAPDGTVTQQMDPVALETAWTAWERLEKRKDLLDAERERARRDGDAQRIAIVQAELDRLEPEIAALAARLGMGAVWLPPQE